jgi:uncharacterized protein YdeI (YjbR/CyaY-like superfamily)
VKPIYFTDAREFHQWLLANHATATELFVGFYKKGSAKVGLTYAEAIDEALCFGWIDGIVRRIDEQRYCHRFTPRKPESIWSIVNVGHVERLNRLGRMQPAGLAAFARRKAAKIGVYSFEQKTRVSLPPEFEKRFRKNLKAWSFFETQAPWYQRLIIHKITNAKQVATKERWLLRAIAASAAGQRIG